MLKSTVEKDGVPFYPVIIVGGGESGIAMGCQLVQQLGFHDFRILERCSGIGGTWHSNRYPGAACDIPAIFYSFSFNPNPKWTSFHPEAVEIATYLQGTIDKFGIQSNIQLDTDVAGARWLEDKQEWEVTTRRLHHGAGDLGGPKMQQMIKEKGESSIVVKQEVIRCKVFVPCAGSLVDANDFPASIPGIENFKGKVFHSALWDPEIVLKDKNVVVLGAGCSAAQLVPRLSQDPWNAKSVTQLMREPSWVAPAITPPGGATSWKYWTYFMGMIPVLSQLLRTIVFLGAEVEWPLFGSSLYGRLSHRYKSKRLVRFMKRSVPEKYHGILEPKYKLYCKRIIYDARWFKSLNDPKLRLTTKKFTSVTSDGIILGPGHHTVDKVTGETSEAEHVPADIIILANGFRTAEWLMTLNIIGKQSKTLHKVWEERGGAQAYQGTAMDGFPNMFIIYGPNSTTGHSSVILATENMVNYSLKFIGPILKGHILTAEIHREAEEAYTADIQAKCKTKVWGSGGCHSWYRDGNDWNSTTLPYSQIRFGLWCMFPVWKDWNLVYTEAGRRSQRSKKLLRGVAIAISVGVLAAYGNGRFGQIGLVDQLRGVVGRLR